MSFTANNFYVTDCVAVERAYNIDGHSVLNYNIFIKSKAFIQTKRI